MFGTIEQGQPGSGAHLHGEGALGQDDSGGPLGIPTLSWDPGLYFTAFGPRPIFQESSQVFKTLIALDITCQETWVVPSFKDSNILDYILLCLSP